MGNGAKIDPKQAGQTVPEVHRLEFTDPKTGKKIVLNHLHIDTNLKDEIDSFKTTPPKLDLSPDVKASLNSVWRRYKLPQQTIEPEITEKSRLPNPQ